MGVVARLARCKVASQRAVVEDAVLVRQSGAARAGIAARIVCGLAVLASAPTDRDRTTQAYFFATQLELLHTYFRTQPAAPPQPPSKGDDGPLGGLHRWWRRVRGQKAKETDGSAEAAPSLAHRVVELAAKEKRG